MLFVCITLVLLADAVLGAAVDTGVIRLATAPDATAGAASEVQKSALVGKLLVSALLLAPLALFRSQLSELLFHDPSHGLLLILAVLSLAATLLLRSVQTYFQLTGRFTLYGIAEIVQGAIKFGGAAVLLWTATATPLSILGVYVAGPLISALVLAVLFASPLLTAEFRMDRLRTLASITRWYICAAAVGSLTTRMDLLILSAQAGPKAAGIFSAAQALIIGFHLLGAYMGVVIAPRIQPLWQAGRLEGIYWRFQAVAVVFCAFAFFLFPWALGLASGLLPASYREASIVVPTLLPSALMSIMNFPWTVTLLMFTQSKSIFLMELFAIPALYLVYSYGIARFGPLGAAGITSFYAVAKTLIFQWLASRTLRLPLVPVAAS